MYSADKLLQQLRCEDCHPVDCTSTDEAEHHARSAVRLANGLGDRTEGRGSWRTGISKGKTQTAHRSRQLVAKVGIRRSPQPGGAVWAVLLKVLLKAQDGAGV